MAEHLPETQDPLSALRERLDTLRAAVTAHQAAWLAGAWTPADDERLWANVARARQRFPLHTLPPCEEFVHGCVAHQFLPLHERDLPYHPSADPQADTEARILEQGIGLLEEAIIAHAEPEGMDLCWEHHLALYERCLGTADLRLALQSRNVFECLRLCIAYREAVERGASG